MSGVVISKLPSVLVRPSSEPVAAVAAGSSIQLFPYDKPFVGASNTALLVFPDPIHQAAERVKTALSQALVLFRLLAGRLVLGAGAGGADGDYIIACTDEGASFVAATAAASSSIKDIESLTAGSLLLPASTLLDDLAVCYDPAQGCCSSTDPLLLMQVTEFSCGGFVVGVTWNHAAADGVGMGHFMRAVGELARGLSAPSIVPVACLDDSLKNGPPLLQALGGFFGGLGPPNHELALLHITISSNLINRVRDGASASNSSSRRRCTVFEAVAAVLWKCRTRAIMSDDPQAPTAIGILVDARPYVGATRGYYRNCTVVQPAVARCGAVANGDILDLVELIQRAKDQIPHALQMQRLEFLLEDQHNKLKNYDYCAVTYWRNLGLDDVDFGGGKPAEVLSSYDQQPRVAPPSNVVTGKSGGGCNVLSLAIKSEHAHAFLHELANLAA